MPGFWIDAEWYWRIFEQDARFHDEPGLTAARDFLHPIAALVKDRVAFDHIEVDADGEGVHVQIGELAVAIQCRDLKLEHLVDTINQSFLLCNLDLAIAIVEARRYELRAVLIRRDEARHRRFARGTRPPTAT